MPHFQGPPSALWLPVGRRKVISVGRGTYFQVQVFTKFLGRKKFDPYTGNMQADLEFQMLFSSDFHIFRMVTFWDGSIECNIRKGIWNIN